MAEQATVLRPAKLPCKRFPFKAVLFALFVVLLPHLPSQAPPELANQAFFTKIWELVHLLFVGITVSYGLFSRKNTDGEVDKDVPARPDAGRVGQVLHGSLVFDDEELPCSPRGDARMQSWNAVHQPNEPVVMVANDGAQRHGADTTASPLSLLVRSLKAPPQGSNLDGDGISGSGGDTVLPSPIPWRSRSGRFDTSQPASPTPSPKNLSPAPSLSKEKFAKTGEDSMRRKSLYKASSPPPAPPPPPPFLGHGHHGRRTAAKSFKEELKDHTIRGAEDYLQSQSSYSFYATSNSSVAKPRVPMDGSSSSVIGKSVRTTRPREVQSQSQEPPDAALHGSEDAYGYSAYQTISKFQYERNVDHVVDEAPVLSDDSESSDDDDGHVGDYSERTSPPTAEMDEHEVDRRAEEFITNFREQIRRQRIESIKQSAGTRGLKHSK